MTGIWLALSLLFGAGVGWAAVVAGAGVTAVAIIAGGRRQAWTIALIGFAATGAFRVAGTDSSTVPDWVGEEGILTGSVASGPFAGGRSQRFDLLARPDGSSDPTAKLCASGPLLPELGFNDRIIAIGRVQRLDEVESRAAGYLRSRGCAGSFQIERITVLEHGKGVHARLDRVRRRLTAALQRTMPGDTGALLAGLVTGDDAGLSTERRDAFIDTGTSHVTAVSGSNLAVIVIVLTYAGGLARRARAGWWSAAMVLALWSYVAVIGVSPPPFRAACVATLALVAVRLGRRPDIVTLSVIVAALELVYRPADFESLAYRLSTVSAIALVLGLAGRSPKGVRGWFMQGIYTTSITQAATSPLLVPMFGRFTVYAIPANLVIAPLCSIAFPFALVAGLTGLVSDTLALGFAAPAAIPARIALAAANLFAGLPYANAGESIASAAPAWVWSAIGISAVVALSRECRGGVKRVAGGLSDLDPAKRAIVSSATAAGIVGILLGLWLR